MMLRRISSSSYWDISVLSITIWGDQGHHFFHQGNKELMKRHIFVIFHVRYIEKKSTPPTGKDAGEEELKILSSGIDKKKVRETS